MRYLFLLWIVLAAGPLIAADWREEVKALADYDYGDSRAAILSLQAEINGAPHAERQKIEDALLPLLSQESMPRGARDEVCRLLVVIGSDRSLPALEKMLGRDDGFLAVYALMDFPNEAASDVLRRVLPGARPERQLEIIGALGRRNDVPSIPIMLEAMKKNVDLTRAVAVALGAMGSPEALAALDQIGSSVTELDWAKIAAARKLLVRDQHRPEVLRVLKPLLNSSRPAVQIGAAEVLANLDAALVEASLVPVLKTGSPRFQLEAARVLAAQTTFDFGSMFAQLTPAQQSLVVLVRAAKGNATLIPQALAYADESVREAGIEAVGMARPDEAVSLLLPFLVRPEKDGLKAFAVLSRISDSATDQKLREAYAGSSSEGRVALLRLYAHRIDLEAWVQVMAACADEDGKVRNAGFEAMGVLAGVDHLGDVVAMAGRFKAPADLTPWGRGLLILAQTTSSPDQVAEILTRAITKVPVEAKSPILGALAGVNSPIALNAFRQALQDPDIDRRKEAIRLLSAVRTGAAMELLWQVAKSGSDPTERILAVRGYLDGLRVQTDLPPKKMAQMYIDLWELAERPEEKAAIVASLKTLKGAAYKEAVKKLSAQDSVTSPPQKS